MEPTAVPTAPRRPRLLIDVTDAGTTAASLPSAPGTDRSDAAASLAALCAVLEQLELIVDRHAGDPATVERIGRVAEHARHAVDHLLVASSERRRAALARGRARHPAGTALASAEDAFLDWVRSADRPDHTVVGGRSLPVRELLTTVLDGRRPLPADVARSLGVSEHTTTGCAVAWLIAAVEDPLGPRCRSYRAALYYLRDLADPAALMVRGHHRPAVTARVTERVGPPVGAA